MLTAGRRYHDGHSTRDNMSTACWGFPMESIVVSNTGQSNVLGVIRNDFPLIDEKSVLFIGSSQYGLKSACGELANQADVRRVVSDFCG